MDREKRGSMSKSQEGSASYRELKEELDHVLQSLQREDLDVDEALELYARGQELIKALEKYLEKAENSVKKIKTSFEE